MSGWVGPGCGVYPPRSGASSGSGGSFSAVFTISPHYARNEHSNRFVGVVTGHLHPDLAAFTQHMPQEMQHVQADVEQVAFTEPGCGGQLLELAYGAWKLGDLDTVGCGHEVRFLEWGVGASAWRGTEWGPVRDGLRRSAAQSDRVAGGSRICGSDA